MSVLRTLASFAAGASTLFFAARGQAFCLTHTCDPRSETCTFDVDGCNVSGKTLFWSSSTVSFDIQKDGSYVLAPDGSFALDDNGNKIVNISADTLDEVVNSAFARWLDADCGQGTHPSIRIKELPRVDCAKPEYNKDQPNANIITFHDTTWPYSSNAQDTLALTTVFYNGETGEIYDANVEINSNKDSFSVGMPTGTQVDLNAVITHELGHFLGLSHSSVYEATMYSSYQIGMTTLESDDELAICASLPPGRATTGDDYTPRHGWSSECASPESGCCATAVGANNAPRQWLGAWLFGLALCAWRGRARLRRARAPRR